MGLILNRRPGQTIVIAEHIQVKILDIIGQQATLVIDAPDTVLVDRMEVHMKKQKQKNTVKRCVTN